MVKKKPIKKEQVKKIARLLADFCGLWVVNSGLKSGILFTISESASPVTAAELARAGGYSLFFAEAWLMAAYSFEILEHIPGKGFELSAHMKEILLNKAGDNYLGSAIMMFSGLSSAYDEFSKRIKDPKKLTPRRQSIRMIKSMAEVTRNDLAVIIDRIINNNAQLRKTMHGRATVLDIGSGLGYAAVSFCKTFPGIKVTALDIDKRQISAAAKIIREENCGKSICLLAKDARRADFKQKFDLIFMNLSLHEIGNSDKERSAFLNKCRRWLKNKGFLLINEFYLPAKMNEFRRLSSQIISGIQVFESISGNKLMTIPGISKLLKKSGFRKIKVIRHPSPLRVFILARR
ncbi:class I SAM-dependent methyltransferase [bacterium]|nr:MAG: class I SAM-dependent methyltransferase [bacterium]